VVVKKERDSSQLLNLMDRLLVMKVVIFPDPFVAWDGVGMMLACCLVGMTLLVVCSNGNEMREGYEFRGDESRRDATRLFV
jgi:hypothetical protein